MRPLRPVPTLVVIEADPFVRQDLSEILALTRGGARVLCVAPGAEASGLLETSKAPDLVFIGDVGATGARARLVRLVEAAGGTSVLIGVGAAGEGLGPSSLVLEAPFTNTSVQAFVAQWLGHGSLALKAPLRRRPACCH